MKTILKEIKLDNLEMELNCDYEHYLNVDKNNLREVKYTFKLPYFIYPKNRNVKIVYEDEQPESLKEFLKDNKLTKEELVEWLNKNYN